MRKLYTILCSFFLLSSVAELSSQKLGYVDSATLMSEIPDFKEANSNVETFTQQFQKKGQDMIKALQAKYQELEQKQQTGSISRVQLEEQAKKLKEEETVIMKFEQESQQKIMKKQEELLAPLRDKVRKAIDDVAAENGFSFIFDLSSGVVLYSDESADCGALVKAKLGL